MLERGIAQGGAGDLGVAFPAVKPVFDWLDRTFGNKYIDNMKDQLEATTKALAATQAAASKAATNLSHMGEIAKGVDPARHEPIASPGRS